jgi:tetratricopeptide (TPR) repeat protein
MTVDLKGKNTVGKQELIILDMLQTNNWQRPMYYAITVSPDQFVKLDGYFQQTGMAYQIVPLDTKNNPHSVHTEKMYDNLMNKFQWGGVDKPGVYLDENVMRMCKSYRMNLFSTLARALIAEGEKEKALNVLDKCMEVLPPENVPLDYSAIYIGEYYYRLGAKEKAEAVYDEMARQAVTNLNWYFRLRPSQQGSIRQTIENNIVVLQEVSRLGEEFHSESLSKYKQDYDNFRMAYSSVQKD